MTQSAPFTVGRTEAMPGSIVSGSLDIAAHGTDRGTSIPFTIVHGLTTGPVLALVAGVHGMEYVPVVALQRLRGSIDARELRGTVVMVHVANSPSFLGRTIYYSPIDGQNLNRVFPGKVDGTVSERIAHALTHEVIDRATHVIDLHGGDGNESLRPYSYWITTGSPAVADDSRALALAFGLDHIVVDDERPREPGASMYLSNTAITRGKPAITTETGCLGRSDEADVELALAGIAGVMRHLGMRGSGPAPVTAPIWLARNAVIRAGASGMLQAVVGPGEAVARGATLARITDFHGRVLETIVAPFAGEVMYVVATPPITKGEPVAMVSAPAPPAGRRATP